MRANALAHPNIALVKYWGKRDLEYNLPAAGSLSMTLDGLETKTTVEFDESLGRDRFELDGKIVEKGRKYDRVVDFLEVVREQASHGASARVRSANNFPTSAGLASSASGFAALALAATEAAGLEWTPRALSALARRGSGSAARSVFGGFVEMLPGQDDDPRSAHATEIAPPDAWDLRCLVAITAFGEKQIGSTEGMEQTRQTSPYYSEWLASVDDDLRVARKAVRNRDFDELATVSERSCLRMHASAMAADPGLLYWHGRTVELIHRVREARREGLRVFFTIDAGPHVKVFCPASEVDAARGLLEEASQVERIIVASPGGPAHTISDAEAP